MAAQIPETGVPILDPIASAINNTIDRLIYALEQRRLYLLIALRDKREETRANQVALKQVEEQLVESSKMLEGMMTHNLLHSMQEKVVTELEVKRAEFRANTPLISQEILFKCDTQYIDKHIDCLGEIVTLEIPSTPIIPNYAEFQQPIVAFGKRGTGPTEFHGPQGFSIQPESGHIYLADRENGRIQVFSSNGDYLNHFGNQHLMKPYGVLIHLDNIYVTDTGHHVMFQFKFPELKMIKQVGEKGSGSDKFNKPKQLAISPNEHICVADEKNDRLQIMTTSLSFQGTLQHLTMTRPSDVKFHHSEVFVLSCRDNPCIHVFGLSGEKIRSIITRGDGMQIQEAYFFCLDNGNNIIISDWYAHCIKVFSPAGDLLHTIGRQGHQAGMFQQPKAISIFHQNEVICISNNSNYGFQIFSA